MVSTLRDHYNIPSMKVLPSLLRKGKTPVFLKPRGEDSLGRSKRTQDGSFPVFPPTQDLNTSTDCLLIEHRIASDDFPEASKSNNENDPPSQPVPHTPSPIPALLPEAQTHPILPSISYPPFSEDPDPINLSNLSSIPHDRQQQPSPHGDAYGGAIQKYYTNTPVRKYYGSSRPLGSFDCYEEETPSPVGVDQFESLQQFTGLKRDGSLEKLKPKLPSVFPSAFTRVGKDKEMAALEELAQSPTEDVYCDDVDSCDLEFSRDSTMPFEDTVDDSTAVDDSTMNYTADTSTLAGIKVQELEEKTIPRVEEETVTEEETTFSDCEYDTNVEDDITWQPTFDALIEKVLAKDTIDSTADSMSQSSLPQFNDEESYASSYLFSLVDDGTDVLKMKRRRKHRSRSNKGSGQLPQAAPGTASLFDAESVSLNNASTTVPPPEPNSCSCTPSLTKMKEDVKTTYLETVQAFHQIMYAFFIIEDDVNHMADKIRGAKFKEEKGAPKATGGGKESQFSKSLL